MRSSAHAPSFWRAMLLLMFVIACIVGVAQLTGNLDYLIKPLYEKDIAPSLYRPLPAEHYIDAYEWAFNDQGALKGWEEKAFNGKTDYRIVDADGGEKALRIQSVTSASALYRKVEIPIRQKPVITWSWRAVSFLPPKPQGAEKKREFDDYVGRVYVIFKGRSILSADIIEYAWEDSLPVGSSFTSPFSDHAKMLVVRSGPMPEGAAWVAEKRDIVLDYRALFGKPPAADIAAVALMSDSDNMKANTEILIKDVTLKIPQPVIERARS